MNRGLLLHRNFLSRSLPLGKAKRGVQNPTSVWLSKKVPGTSKVAQNISPFIRKPGSLSPLFIVTPFSVANPFLVPKRNFSNMQPPRRNGVWGVVATVGAVAVAKFKYILAALKFLKMGPLVSMVISSAAYSMLYGWSFGIGMVGMIFVHGKCTTFC